MDFDLVFSLSSLLVMPFWLLMIFAGFWKFTERVISVVWILVPAALLYSILVLPDIAGVLGQVSNPSLDGIAALLGTPQGATIAWVHFLAFDVFVGRWAYLDGREQRIPWYLVSITLVFILMLGPLGFLLYLALQTIWNTVRRNQRPTEAGGQTAST
ncbi:MAG: DUF4281 domain-containing protein [Chloroflexi bacterium]|nr:DUF4281 domain-containing protein [Chloroflexota bacterium]